MLGRTLLGSPNHHNTVPDDSENLAETLGSFDLGHTLPGSPSHHNKHLGHPDYLDRSAPIRLAGQRSDKALADPNHHSIDWCSHLRCQGRLLPSSEVLDLPDL